MNKVVCSTDTHQSNIYLFCNHCRDIICIGCLDYHRNHEIISIDLAYQEIFKDKEFQINTIESKVKKKMDILINSAIKFKEMQEFYMILEDKIKGDFRNLHDQLHIREVSIMREIRTYLEENSVEYIKVTSALQNEIDTSNQLVSELKSETNRLEAIKTYLSNKNYLASEDANKDSETLKKDEVSYTLCSFPTKEIDELETTINCLGLDLGNKASKTTTAATTTTTTTTTTSKNTKDLEDDQKNSSHSFILPQEDYSKKKIDQVSKKVLVSVSSIKESVGVSTTPSNIQTKESVRVNTTTTTPSNIQTKGEEEENIDSKWGNQIIVYGSNGLERFSQLEKFNSTSNRKYLKYNTTSSALPLLNAYENYFFQNSSKSGQIFLFCTNIYWMINLDDKNPKWESGPCDLKGSCPSTIYDGNELIYIFGGYSTTDREAVKSIYTFNIKTKIFTHLGEKMLINAAYINLSMSGTDRIYLMGGFNNQSNWLERIDYFDIKEQVVRSVCNTKQLGIAAINWACMVPSQNSVYIFAIEYSFHRYNIDKGTIHKLTSPTQNERGRSKLFYDGKDTIYLVTCGNGPRSLQSYTISTNTWKISQMFFNSLKSGEFISFSQSTSTK